ncbi:MAG: FHA domain-containing protein [Cyanobacteria bacterium CRU_2_1]|nr:FHA domain-containing protein [Cyanobacteria bacterium RU_5_0]NJR60211.1 FHA domain-containing protein [Cyanobacteria bacterium CRU_2_1]
MSNSPSPLVHTVTPERWIGWSMDFIGAGYVGLLVKNGQLLRMLTPGRHFSFALPWLEQCQIVLVDSKIRNLEFVSRGDFLSHDQFLVNVSLSVMYQVVDPRRVALELSDPIAALTSATKDNLGVVINQMSLNELIQQGRVRIRQHLMNHIDSFYAIGFNLEDIRVSDISFPQAHGVVRQVEGLTAREEATHQAALRAQIEAAGRTAHVQQINVSSHQSPANLPLPDAIPTNAIPTNTIPKATVVIPKSSDPVKLPLATDRKALPPTTLASNVADHAACLIHRGMGTATPLSANPFTIGREPHNTLVLESGLCSRNHARIERVVDAQSNIRYQLIDVGSSNGTMLNNQRLAANYPYPLSSGNIIKIGNDEWVFEA